MMTAVPGLGGVCKMALGGKLRSARVVPHRSARSFSDWDSGIGIL